MTARFHTSVIEISLPSGGKRVVPARVCLACEYLAVTPHQGIKVLVRDPKGFCVTHVPTGGEVVPHSFTRAHAEQLCLALSAMEGVDWGHVHREDDELALRVATVLASLRAQWATEKKAAEKKP